MQRTFLFFITTALLFGCSPKSKGGNNTQSSPKDLQEKNMAIPKIPPFGKEFWINAGPELVNNLKGKIVLVDFWEYTCVNCIRTFPYIKEWNKRYANKGLVILGVHAPEFEFGKKRENVEQAAKKFGLTYPIVLDNDYTIWTIFGNRYWPAKYIFDKNGILRYQHFGEGSYGDTEATIQKLLKELDMSVELPPLLEPIRAEDKPGAVCYRPTPETYLGYERGHIGNKEGHKKDREVAYADPGSYKDNTYYLVGRWHIGPESVRLATKDGDGSIIITYEAAEVNLVIHPESGPKFRVDVLQDGKHVPAENRGEDLKTDSGGATYLLVDSPRMFNIITNKTFDRHLLKLTSSSSSFGAYAFTFTTQCIEPKE